ncbi:hypothetical protein FGADI_7236 [Fusarium gaditjirri]|uniref:Uncharacterized protein n=1 Tax=Fusarium gaditjirri TaxID=282569 RepID=A0A8H4T5U1_9HYPO|nr:hypothetical protein FGADI_7236 [Fusarium gaditjirri]
MWLVEAEHDTGIASPKFDARTTACSGSPTSVGMQNSLISILPREEVHMRLWSMAGVDLQSSCAPRRPPCECVSAQSRVHLKHCIAAPKPNRQKQASRRPVEMRLALPAWPVIEASRILSPNDAELYNTIG